MSVKKLCVRYNKCSIIIASSLDIILLSSFSCDHVEYIISIELMVLLYELGGSIFL